MAHISHYSDGMNSADCHVVIIPLSDQRKPYELQSLLDCIAIRERVFIEEQQVPQDIEQDGKDSESGHVLLWSEGIPAGTLRFRVTDEGIKMERIAVLPELRGRHLGKLLIREGLRAVRMNGLDQQIYIHAQQQASSFYASLGFEETGEHTVEAGILHTTMCITSEKEHALLETDPHSL
jgi:predicted GNAT family N-acyltransferase